MLAIAVAVDGYRTSCPEKMLGSVVTSRRNTVAFRESGSRVASRSTI